jgi:hypothetical protein
MSINNLNHNAPKAAVSYGPTDCSAMASSEASTLRPVVVQLIPADHVNLKHTSNGLGDSESNS